MGHSKAELPSTQTESTPSADLHPVSKTPRLNFYDLLDLMEIITIREKDDSLREPPGWKEAATSIKSFLNSSLKGAEILEEKDGKIRCDFDAISNWCKVTNLTHELKTAQKAELGLEDHYTRKVLIQLWISYLNGLLNPKRAPELESPVFETLFEFLKKAHSELLERVQLEMPM